MDKHSIIIIFVLNFNVYKNSLIIIITDINLNLKLTLGKHIYSVLI